MLSDATRHNMMPRKFWTLEENERLKALGTEGISVSEIAKSLGRTPGAVRGQGRTLGIKFPAPPSRKKETVARRLSSRFDRLF
jgi:hypothetical protein